MVWVPLVWVPLTIIGVPCPWESRVNNHPGFQLQVVGPKQRHEKTTRLWQWHYHLLQWFLVAAPGQSRWFSFIFGYFHPYILGEDEPILTSIFFQMGWFNHQLAIFCAAEWGWSSEVKPQEKTHWFVRPFIGFYIATLKLREPLKINGWKMNSLFSEANC